MLGLLVLIGCGPGEVEGPRETSGNQTPQASPPLEIGREPSLDVLLITIDTLRADALGAYGAATAETPWIDRLAAGGARFAEARAHSVVTLPSHATILSGLLPQQHGVRDNSGFVFPEDVETLATILDGEGYRTGAFISAFPLDSRFGLDHGFEVYEDSFVGVASREAFLEQERSGPETVALATAWLDDPDPRPTFTWVHLYEPHYPYEPPEPFASRFRDNPYAGDVAAVDTALAPLLEPILAAGDAGKTLVILTSDHGESLGEHGEATHGIFGYEGALRVPLVIYQPRLLPAAVVGDAAGLVDILPTTLDLLALPIPKNLAGRSLFAESVASGEKAPNPTYFEALSGQLNRGWAPLYGVVENGWKFIDLPLPELYDLSRDPGEAKNLHDQRAERREELQEILGALRGDDTGPTPDPVSAETRRRLASLGYLSAGDTVLEQTYDEDDDPKRLIGLDEALRQIAGLYHEGRLDAARDRSRDLVRRRPDMRIAHMLLAQIERDRGNIDAAIEAMQRALSLNPDDATALAMLATYLTQANRAAEAADLTRIHVERSRPDTDVLVARALALARSGKGSEALATLDAAQGFDPENPLVFVYRGTVLLLTGQRDAARAAYERALTLYPGTVRAHTALAVMATEERRIDDALSHWQRSLELDQKEGAKLYGLAARLWQSGRSTEARPLLELFLESASPARFDREIRHARSLLDGR